MNRRTFLGSLLALVPGVEVAESGRRYWRGQPVLTDEEARHVDFPYPPEPDWEERMRQGRLMEWAKRSGRLQGVNIQEIERRFPAWFAGPESVAMKAREELDLELVRIGWPFPPKHEGVTVTWNKSQNVTIKGCAFYDNRTGTYLWTETL